MKRLDRSLEVKRSLLAECKRIQSEQINTARTAMEHAQESAKEEKAGAEDQFESFREQLQLDRNMYAKQWDEALSAMAILNKIDVQAKNETIIAGSVVITNLQTFFIALSLGEIKIGRQKYFAISTSSPLFKAMAGKKIGDSFSFRDKVYQIMEVF